MDAKLKALKVVDLKQVLSAANVSVPAKSTKSDLISKILASKHALDVYAKLHPADDLLAPPEEVDWNAEHPELAPESASASLPPQTPVEPKSPVKPAAALTRAPPSPTLVATTTTSSVEKASDDPELEKHKRRAERFGIPLVQPSQNIPKTKKANGESAEQSAKRNTSKSDNPAPSNEKKRPAPKADEADPEELERRKKRAARFGVPFKS